MQEACCSDPLITGSPWDPPWPTSGNSRCTGSEEHPMPKDESESSGTFIPLSHGQLTPRWL